MEPLTDEQVVPIGVAASPVTKGAPRRGFRSEAPAHELGRRFVSFVSALFLQLDYVVQAVTANYQTSLG